MSGTTMFEEDLWESINHVLANKGAVFTDHLVFAAAGTGTSRASITTTYPVPNTAVELLAVKPIAAAGANTAAADSILAMFDIQGNSFQYQPMQIIGPLGGPVLSAGQVQMTPSEWYTVRARCSPGDFYDYGVTPLVANSHNFRASYELLWATAPSGDAPIASQVSAVQTFTAQGTNSSGTITLTNAKYLYETATAIVSGAVTAAQPILTYTNLQCSGMSPIQSINYHNESSATAVSTTASASVLSISRVFQMGIKFTIPNPVLTYSIYNDVAVSNAAQVAHMVRYIKG